MSIPGGFLRILAIETSERVGTLATLQATEEVTEVVAAVGLPAEQRTARSLLPAIQKLLSDSAWAIQQLDLICVTSGPGSFTGLRIGVTTAKTLAYALEAELVEVHTLAAMAAGVTTGVTTELVPLGQRLWTVLDAQRNELFVAAFQSGWQPADPPVTRILGVEAWLQELQAGDRVSGPPLQKLAHRLPADVLVADAADWPPRAQSVGQLGIAAYRSGKVVEAMQLVPSYFRKSAAEEKAEKASAATSSKKVEHPH